MVTKTIEIEVIDGDVSKATQEVNKLDSSLNKVDKSAKKAGKETAQSLDGVGESADNLRGGLEGGVDEFKKLSKAAKTGGAAMRSALISTGIGALVVLVGVLVDNWEQIGTALGFINRDLEKQIQLQKDLIDESEHELTILGLKQKQLEAQGKSAEHLLEARKQETQQLIVQNELLLEKLKLQLKNEQSAAVELSTFQKIVSLASGRQLIGEVTEEEQENIRKINEEIQSTEVSIEKLKLSLIELNNPKVNTTSASGVSRAESRETDVASFDGESGIADPFNEQKELDAKRLQALREGTEEFALANNERIDVEVQALTKSAEIQNQKTADEKAQADARIRIAEAEAYAKEQLLFGVADSLQAVSEIAGRETGAGKALAVAASLINTYSAIAGQLKAFSGLPIPGYAIAQAIATGAAGFAAVKNILKVKVPNDRSSGNGSFSGGGGGVAAPAFNVVGTSGVNQLAQSLNQEQNPIRAFVVGGDITSQQELERNTIETASI